MEKREKLYEGKAKAIYSTEDPKKVVLYFKDDATAFDGEKKGTIFGKGEMNCTISAKILPFLEENGVPTHFIEQTAPNEMLVKNVEIVPVEVVMRNIAAGSISRRLGIEEGTDLPAPILEWYYKDDALHDPPVNCDHIKVFGWATGEELLKMREYGEKVNDLLVKYFKERGIKLVDFKLEFGRTKDGELVLADEITPDGCRLWDAKTNEKLDKDRFRRDLGNVEEAYKKVLELVIG